MEFENLTNGVCPLSIQKLLSYYNITSDNKHTGIGWSVKENKISQE